MEHAAPHAGEMAPFAGIVDADPESTTSLAQVGSGEFFPGPVGAHA